MKLFDWLPSDLLKAEPGHSLPVQLRRLRIHILGGFGFGLLVVSGVFILSVITKKPMSFLTIDPADVNFQPAYMGVLSHFGVMLWTAASSISLFGSMLLRSTIGGSKAATFLGTSGLLSLLLTLDDALLLHDRVFPDAFGVPEIVIYAVFAVLFALYFFRAAPMIFQSDYLLLLLALFFLGTSVAMDMVLPFTPGETAIEDSMKFLGIIFWFLYYARATASLLAPFLSVESSSVLEAKEEKNRSEY